MVPKYPRIFRNRFRFILVPKYSTTPGFQCIVACFATSIFVVLGCCYCNCCCCYYCSCYCCLNLCKRPCTYYFAAEGYIFCMLGFKINKSKKTTLSLSLLFLSLVLSLYISLSIFLSLSYLFPYRCI